MDKKVCVLCDRFITGQFHMLDVDAEHEGLELVCDACYGDLIAELDGAKGEDE